MAMLSTRRQVDIKLEKTSRKDNGEANNKFSPGTRIQEVNYLTLGS